MCMVPRVQILPSNCHVQRLQTSFILCQNGSELAQVETIYQPLYHPQGKQWSYEFLHTTNKCMAVFAQICQHYLQLILFFSVMSLDHQSPLLQSTTSPCSLSLTNRRCHQKRHPIINVALSWTVRGTLELISSVLSTLQFTRSGMTYGFTKLYTVTTLHSMLPLKGFTFSLPYFLGDFKTSTCTSLSHGYKQEKY